MRHRPWFETSEFPSPRSTPEKRALLADLFSVTQAKAALTKTVYRRSGVLSGIFGVCSDERTSNCTSRRSLGCALPYTVTEKANECTLVMSDDEMIDTMAAETQDDETQDSQAFRGCARQALPGLVSNLNSDEEVECAVRAVINSHVKGGVRSLMSSICSEEEEVRKSGVSLFNSLRSQLGKPFSKYVVKAGGAEMLIDAVLHGRIYHPSD